MFLCRRVKSQYLCFFLSSASAFRSSLDVFGLGGLDRLNMLATVALALSACRTSLAFRSAASTPAMIVARGIVVERSLKFIPFSRAVRCVRLSSCLEKFRTHSVLSAVKSFFFVSFLLQFRLFGFPTEHAIRLNLFCCRSLSSMNTFSAWSSLILFTFSKSVGSSMRFKPISLHFASSSNWFLL